VLIAAWNEADHIGWCLSALAAIEWPRLEVLVSAGGSDGTFDVASQYVGDRIRVFEQRPGLGKQAALRDLYSRSTGDVIYLTDGDTIVPEATFVAVLEPILRGEAGAVTGNYRPYPEAISRPLVFYQWSIDRAVERRRGATSEGITGANAAVSRLALDAVGAFDADVKTGTDYHLARQLRNHGFQIRYVDAGVETEYADRITPYINRRARWLRNTFMHGRRHGDKAEVRSSALTMAVATAVVAAPLTFRLTRWFGLATWMGLTGMLLKRRIQYMRALATDLGAPLPGSIIVQLPLLTLADQLASVRAATDLLSAKGRTRW
jgi:cellulose synthase/poly-beta-1,6-N-acetylglucosamine synthase-like glycosyltransferase